MNLKFPNKWTAIALIYLAGFLIQYLYLDLIFTAPNSTIFATGGDGFFIYYNLLFHTCWGEGLTLSGMNYPWGEYIFLTDSMAAFSVIFNFLDGLGLPICEHAIGIMNSVIICLVPLTAIFLYLILMRLKVLEPIAFFAALLICFLSPQIGRFLSHFGLAFPFLIPACMWWYLHIKERKIIDKYGYFIIFLILFFGLNNPYLGFICSAFLGLTFCFNFLFDKQFKFLFKGIMVSAIPLLIILTVVKGGDPFDDRIAQQWGFFHYAADIRGLIMGDGSLFNKWFGGLISIPEIKWESRVTIGVVSTMILLGMAMYGVVKRKNILPSGQWGLLLPVCFSALMLYVFGAHFFLPKTTHYFVEEHMGFLTMFKAAARFLWPAYYLLSILAVLGLNQLVLRLRLKQTILAVMVSLILFSIWAAEVGQYVRHRFEGFRYSNALQDKKEDIDHLIDSLDLSPDHYQAIYVLPIMQGWNDKFYVNEEYVSSHYGLVTSFRSQIPIINAKLSRMSMSQTILSQQFASPSLVERELIPFLRNDKPILIIKSNKAKLKEGEKYLTEISSLLYEEKRFSLYSLRIEDLQENKHLENVRNNFSEIDTSLSYRTEGDWYYHNGFETDNGEAHQLYGRYKSIEYGMQNVDLVDLSAFKMKQKYWFSIWVYIDHYKYGLPEWRLNFINDEGKILREDMVSSRHPVVFYENWARVDRTFDIPDFATKLKISARTNQSFDIDELLISPVGDSIYSQLPNHQTHFMFNNFIIKCEKE